MYKGKDVAVRMDIRTAVSNTEVQVLNKNTGFFIDSEFGRVCFEVNPFKEVNPLKTVVVTKWSDAPSTSFVREHMDDAADFYCGVDIYDSMITDHLSIIEAYTRCMFISLGFDQVDDSIIDAATNLFVAAYDSFSININMIEREFVKNHIKSGGFGRRNREIMQAVIRELFKKKIAATELISRKSSDLLDKWMKEHPSQDPQFYDEYCREVFGIILYATNEAKNNAVRSYSLLLDFNNETNIEKSITVYGHMLKNAE